VSQALLLGAALNTILLALKPRRAVSKPTVLATEVTRMTITYTVTPPPTPPQGTITRVDPPSGSYIAPGTTFACVIWFRNDANVTYTYFTRFIGVGAKTGTTYFDVTSASASIAPGVADAMSSGNVKMPSEDLNVTIIVYC
jgi:hypothetical protein